jgi:hypothetical protein
MYSDATDSLRMRELTVSEVFVEKGKHLIVAGVGGAKERVTVFIKVFLHKQN